MTSTPFLTSGEINVDETDLLDDAWGFKSEFHDVFNFLGDAEPEPGEYLTGRVMAMINSV